MAHRYYTNNILGDNAIIQGDDALHLSKVMRVKVGDKLILCDAKSTDYTAVVKQISLDEIVCDIVEKSPSISEPSCNVTLYIGYPKQDKLEFIIQKSVELGITKIVPFFSKNCVVTSKKEEQKNIRYNKIAYEAAKQSGRGIIPTVEMPLTYKQVIAQQQSYDISLLCYEAQTENTPLHSRLQNKQSIALIVGAEGGFTLDEVENAKQNCDIISLGKRILRCETAAIVATTAVMLVTGNLQ